MQAHIDIFLLKCNIIYGFNFFPIFFFIKMGHYIYNFVGFLLLEYTFGNILIQYDC